MGVLYTDGDFPREQAKILRQYADMIESGDAGHDQVETFTNENGTRLFRIGATHYGGRI
jgi:hypothetical protein